jgi:hypothetical protein
MRTLDVSRGRLTCLFATGAAWVAAISLEQLCKVWLLVMMMIAAHICFLFLCEVKQIALQTMSSPIQLATSTAASWTATYFWEAVMGKTANTPPILAVAASRWGSGQAPAWSWSALSIIANLFGLKCWPGVSQLILHIFGDVLPQVLLLWN